jgi:DNA-binding transcriptional LysR family regulator
VNETTLGIEMALAGIGLTYCLEARVAVHLKQGRLQIVLPDWSPMEPPFHIYYPGHRQTPPGLRELIDTLKRGSD